MKEVWFQILYKSYLIGHKNRCRCMHIIHENGNLAENQMPSLPNIKNEDFTNVNPSYRLTW